MDSNHTKAHPVHVVLCILQTKRCVKPPDENLITVNSSIFLRVLFSRNKTILKSLLFTNLGK